MSERRGRKTKLTPQLQTRLCGFLSQGLPIKAACHICKVAERTYHAWVSRGEKGEPMFEDFFSAASRARATYLKYLIGRVHMAAEKGKKGDWRAYAFLLERRFPQYFGPTEPRPLPSEKQEGMGMVWVFDTGGKTLAEALDFPHHYPDKELKRRTEEQRKS